MERKRNWGHMKRKKQKKAFNERMEIYRRSSKGVVIYRRWMRRNKAKKMILPSPFPDMKEKEWYGSVERVTGNMIPS